MLWEEDWLFALVKRCAYIAYTDRIAQSCAMLSKGIAQCCAMLSKGIAQCCAKA